MKPWIRFEDIEIRRESYYVKYSPKFISEAHDDLTAILYVRLLQDYSLEECKSIVESEFEYWVQRFPVPLQALVKFGMR